VEKRKKEYLSIGLSIFQEVLDELNRLNRVTSLSSSVGVHLGMSRPANTTIEATERNAVLVVHNVVQVSLGPTQRHSLDGHSGFSCVLCCN
jgi:hypothetical protein